MSRVTVIDPVSATGETKALLDAVKSQFGVVPNMFRVLANSTPALKGFLGLHGGMSGASLDPAIRERIALALAQANGCEYCLSAHTAIGRKAGLDNAEIAAARSGSSADTKAAAAVAFALTLNTAHGTVTQAEFAAVRRAGYSDGQIVEIVLEVAINLLTNILNKAVDVEIDFPKVGLKAAA
jgi:uncharacterized peroxidase-related enzyme